MSTPVTATSPLNVLGTTNPSTVNQRRITAEVSGDQLSSTTTNTGNTKIFQDAGKKLGKQDFLNLLVTQMRFQDPLSPTENTEFVAQLAQFSNLEGTQNINTSIDDLGKKLEAMVSGQASSATTISNSSATSLIGKQVRVNAESILFDPANNAPIDINVHADAGTKSVVTILDDKENIVNALELDKTGDLAVQWSGIGADGKMSPRGNYHLRVTDTITSLDSGYTFLEDRVTGLDYSTKGVRLEVRGQSLALDQVLHVGEEKVTEAAP